MRKTFLSTVAILALVGAAHAADLAAYKAPPAPPTPLAAPSWTGLYGGLDIGYTNGSFQVNRSPGTGTSNGDTGIFGGGHFGYNYQIGSIVIGGEMDAALSSQKATIGTRVTTDITQPWIATARARVGFVPTQSLLLYATGGGAYGDVQVATPGATIQLPGVGWVAGAGVEWSVLSPHVPIRVQYLHTDLSGPSVTTSSGSLNTHSIDNKVEGGISYLFN